MFIGYRYNGLRLGDFFSRHNSIGLQYRLQRISVNSALKYYELALSVAREDGPAVTCAAVDRYPTIKYFVKSYYRRVLVLIFL